MSERQGYNPRNDYQKRDGSSFRGGPPRQGNYNRSDRGGDRNGYQPRGDSEFHSRGGGNRFGGDHGPREGPPTHNRGGMSGPPIQPPQSQENEQLHANSSNFGFYTQQMRQEMPDYFLKIFRANRPLDYIPPVEGLAKKNYSIKGYQPLIDAYTNVMDRFEDSDQPVKEYELKSAAKARMKKEKMMNHLIEQKKLQKVYNPKHDKKIRGDPYKTIFVGRLSYKTDEARLMDNFDMYGRIKRCTLIKDTDTQKSKGYAFIEYYEERNAQIAYSRGDKKKIDGMYCLVDKELGRTDRYWLPRRLGGGKGAANGNRSNATELAYVKDLKKEIKKQAADKIELEKLKSEANMKSELEDTSTVDPNPLKRQKLSEPVQPIKQSNQGFIAMALKQNFIDQTMKKKESTPTIEDMEEGEL